MIDRPDYDPLSAAVSLLRPQSVHANLVSGAGHWAVHYSAFGQPSFCRMLEGSCWLHAHGAAPRILGKGDFLLLSSTPAFTIASGPDALPLLLPRSPDLLPTDELRHGDVGVPPAMVMIGGSFAFGSGNVSLLLSILPRLIHIDAAHPEAERIARLVDLIHAEASARRRARDPILIRAIEILLIEALRIQSPDDVLARTGLLAGLDDPRLAKALHALHADMRRRWTVAELARAAGMSRAAFSAKFSQTVGLPPMDYLLQWRIALAKDLLRYQDMPLADVAAAVGYQSASAFSSAFSRSVGTAPSLFAREMPAFESPAAISEQFATDRMAPSVRAEAA